MKLTDQQRTDIIGGVLAEAEISNMDEHDHVLFIEVVLDWVDTVQKNTKEKRE